MSDGESTDQQLLAGYVDVWWQAINDFTDLLEALPVEAWSTPTDLPGWDVQGVAAHIAHLESILTGAPEETIDVGEPAHVTGPMGIYTEQGVVARREHTPDQIVNEIREAATRRHTALLADPPSDAKAIPEVVFGGVPWTWGTLLRNRPLDVWMHEQDIRRAVARPGGLDSAAAQHVTDYLIEGLGFVLAKRVGAPAGTIAVLDVDGSAVTAYAVNDAGRGQRLTEIPANPTVRLAMDRESFICLAGGRCAAPGSVHVEGDEALGQQLLDHLATTP